MTKTYKDWTLEYDDIHHFYIFKSPRGGAKSSSVIGYGENGSCIGNFIENFEKFYGKKADKKRKLYNGMLKCNIYQYFKNNSKG